MLKSVTVVALLSVSSFAQANWQNGAVFTAQNTQGKSEAYLLPRWIDNSTHLIYGTGGFRLRTADGRNVLVASNSGYIQILGPLVFADGSIQTTAAVPSQSQPSGSINNLIIGSQQLLDNQTFSLDLRRTYSERTELRIIPHGSGHACGSEFTMLNTDIYDDPNNYELMTICTRDTGYLFQSQAAGTGTLRPFAFDAMGGFPSIYFNTDGSASFLGGMAANGISVDRGVASDGKGMKHMRVQISIPGHSVRLSVVKWKSAFADESYTPTCTTISLQSLRVERIEYVHADEIGVAVSNSEGGPASGTLSCIAMHDLD